MSWAPPTRPRWVDRLIALGESTGASTLVGLDSEELIATARRETGLDDFGGDGWREHYDVLLRALEVESRLHVLGRTLVRTEILRTLRNRLELTELWRQRPEILRAPVEAPVFIVGSARSGTSILHELMATDPATRSPAMWEMHHPLAATQGLDRSDVCDREVQLWHDIQPEYETMHANSGHLPNECIFITLHEFLSDHWGGCHQVPTYDMHLARADQRPAYLHHARFLKTLQSAGGPRRWLLKAPSHLFQLRALFDVYPDARIIRTHRDPLRTLPSMINLMGTLKWMRCSEVDLSAAPKVLPAGLAGAYRREIDWRRDGTLPDAQFIDVHFAEVVARPTETIRRIYEALGWPADEACLDRVASYAAAKPQGARGLHRYSLEDAGLDAATERERFRAYTEHFDVAEEPLPSSDSAALR